MYNACKIDKYLNKQFKNCLSKKHLFGKLVLPCEDAVQLRKSNMWKKKKKKMPGLQYFIDNYMFYYY